MGKAPPASGTVLQMSREPAQKRPYQPGKQLLKAWYSFRAVTSSQAKNHLAGTRRFGWDLNAKHRNGAQK
jgi:hypothetical protein